jgi:hypothetical protein
VNCARLNLVLPGEVIMESSPRALSRVDSSDQYAAWDAAYIFGSLSDSDRREYEAHLRTCQSCRQSVDDLSGMPALLGQLSADDVAAIDDGDFADPPLPPRILPSLLATVSRKRRNARIGTWSAAAAVAAAVMVFGVLIGVQLHPGAPATVPPRADAALTMTPVSPTDLTATVSMTGHGWGTQIDMNCTYHEAGTSALDTDEPAGRLAMVVIGRDGSHERLATWATIDGVTATPAGSTSIPIDQVASVQIVSADTGKVLLQRTV